MWLQGSRQKHGHLLMGLPLQIQKPWHLEAAVEEPACGPLLRLRLQHAEKLPASNLWLAILLPPLPSAWGSETVIFGAGKGVPL
mmetsp:Transcript_113815/g.226512  ORF Transcript_113815/g.226512 Transcript_113815/m.226512 type:complete len:84 (-) Transcript_113815:125-376(-)